MTAVDAMKKAIYHWWLLWLPEAKAISHEKPDWVCKLLQIVHRLKHEVFNFETGEWEYEGF